MSIINSILQSTEEIKVALKKHIEIAEILEIEKEDFNLFHEINSVCKLIEKMLTEVNIKDNYLLQFQQSFDGILNNLPFRNIPDLTKFRNPHLIASSKSTLESTSKQLKIQLDNLNFNINFFNKLNFFSNNIVAIGANGSGKTTLANHLRTYLQNIGIVVSAQRVLNIPQFHSIDNPTRTLATLKRYQEHDKTYKNENCYSNLRDEFNVILQNLLAENIFENNNYSKQALLLAKEDKPIPNPPISNLIKAFSIWNDLLEHRVIDTIDGVNIVVRVNENPDHYQAIQMSDGEKVILYLIAQILQAPKDGFIIVDEPEMHLHKTILKKLWNRLEAERDDCIFIYLTHDLDFATSRNTAKKIWLKSYAPPQNWEFENISPNELPESLMLELLGSRRTILFCEGEKGKIDESIYQHLFPNYSIVPVGNCTAVINYTRAYNKLPDTYSKAIGVIDADFHETAEIESLKKDGIFTYEVAEPENLFLNVDYLLLLAKQLMKEDDIDIDNIKANILSKFETDKELQISNYLSAKINYLYSASHVNRGNTKDNVIANLDSFNSNIKIEDWYNEREKEIDRIIAEKDYNNAILLYNNKGLKQIVNQQFKIADFHESSLRLLARNLDAKNILLQYYPDEMKEF